MLRDVSRSQVTERIQYENPWWLDGHIEKDYRAMPRRLYFNLFRPLVYETDIRRAIVLMGPRRVGKTVMLHHLVEDLISSGVNPQKIVFVTIENPIYNNIGLEELFNLAKRATGLSDRHGWYVIFDEIQYLKGWEVHLKSLVDSYRQDKFIVSGSAAAALQFASNESGAGRFTDFLLPPLTFHEYIHLCSLESIIRPVEVNWNGKRTDFYTSTHLNELNEHFLNYINFGGYPEVIFSTTLQSNPGRYIRHDIIDKVLLRDLPGLYGISDTRELNSLFTVIAYNSANEFSLDHLSQKSGVVKNTIKKYLEYLEAAFLIRRIRRVDQSGKKFKRDNFFKMYLTNPSLRSALFSPITFNDESIGNMVETAIYAQWMHRDWFIPWYARWRQGEVDMVALGPTLRPRWAVEIKWTNRFYNKPQDLRSLYTFCKENSIQRPVVTTIDKVGEKPFKDLNIQFWPAAAYAYTVGRRTLDHKSTDKYIED